MCGCCCKKQDGSEKKEASGITKCMGGVFNDNVKRFRFVSIIVLALLGIGAIVCASFISPLTQEDSMLPDDHPI